MSRFLSKKEILDRIKTFYNLKNNAKLAAFLGIPPTTLSSWYTRDTFDLDIIYEKCVDIDLAWLLTGEGSMLKEKQPEEKTVANVVDTSYIYNMYKDYRNMQAEKDIEIKELRTKIDELHAKIEKQNDTIITLIAENKELEERLDVLDPLQLPPVGDVLQKKSLSSQIQPIASVPVRTGKGKSSKI